ncbi:hypothetical protein C5468_02510 [Photorhabdus luminescens subsp. mexicana]|uniref:Uncharacterized protein n=1 Tax=Photorhabdus luminescens subsp. mexicana TaxID=2100167 RepID=A0A4R4JNK9_PHOLU|nr:hypothetical protein C5468_02510 [Photorhabdus luminescens subsp. mexicana]
MWLQSIMMKLLGLSVWLVIFSRQYLFILIFNVKELVRNYQLAKQRMKNKRVKKSVNYAA